MLLARISPTKEPSGAPLHLCMWGTGLVSLASPARTWRGPEPFRKMQ